MAEGEITRLRESNLKGVVCCHPSRPGRFMVFMQMEKCSRSHWDVWHAFIHGWASHARWKLRVYLHVSCHGPCSPEWHPSWHLSPCIPHHHHPQPGVSTCLSTRGEQSQQSARNDITQRNSVHASLLHVMGTVSQTQSKGFQNTSYQAP